MTASFLTAQFASDWEDLAWRKLKSARHLAQIRQLPDAYEAAGIALECAFKARIMRKERLNAWPPRNSRPELYTHDPTRLLRLSGLEPDILAELSGATDIGVAWSVAQAWSIEDRYAVEVPSRVARDMVEAVASKGGGLVKWFLEH